MTSKKRWAVTAVAAVAAVGSLFLTGPHPRAQARVRARPNVLVIVTDDQRTGLSVMPNTRKYLVRQGVKYPNAYVTTPLCCPSRSSIMTGRYAHNTGVTSNGGMAGALDQQTTIQHYLHQAGYRTGLFGKFLNGWHFKDPPYFDHYALTRGRTYYDGTYNVDGTLRTVHKYSTTFLGDQALNFISGSSSAPNRPWYAYLAFIAPHAPFTAQARYQDASVPRWNGDPAVFEKDRSDKPRYVRRQNATFNDGATIASKQYRTLLSVDHQIGRILGKLKSDGQLANTAVFFISDNAYMWGEHGLLGKGYPYPEDDRVPMLVRYPHHVGAGTTDRRMAANIDIAPTIYDLAGIHPPIELDGRDLLDHSWQRSRLLIEFWCYQKSCRPFTSDLTPTHQYTEYYKGDAYQQDGSYIVSFREYYNLSRDPWELTNLLHDGKPGTGPSSSRLDRLHRRLKRERSCRGSDRCP